MLYDSDNASLRAQLAESRQYHDLLLIMAGATGLAPAVCWGLVSRESGWGLLLTPKGPAGTGDGGHGRGLAQIDDRSFPEFCAGETWTKPADNLAMAARVYLGKRSWLAPRVHLVDDDLNEAALAAYNCGEGNVRNALEAGLSAEHFTAHGNYVTDILSRAAWYLENESNMAP